MSLRDKVRYRHYLQPATAGHWPSRVLCVACDSDMCSTDDRPAVSSAVLRSVVCQWLVLGASGYHTAGWCKLTSADSWWREVASQCDDTGYTWVLCADAARVWALLDLWGELESERLHMVGHDEWMQGEMPTRKPSRPDGLCVLQCPPAIIKLRPCGKAGSVTMLDIANYGVDYDAAPATASQCVAWLAAWVQGMWSALGTVQLGALQLTAGSTAMHGWRHGYYSGGVYGHCDSEGLSIESKGYYGGRAECYMVGRIAARVWHLDFRSLYTAIMYQYTLPARLRGIVHGDGAASEAYRARPGRCIATVAIETDEPVYPYRRQVSVLDDASDIPVGVATRQGVACTDTIYPVGRYWTTLPGPELDYAARHGHIRAWRELGYYDMEPCLHDYAVDMYDFRCRCERESSPAVCASVKRLCNALPGKFGQRHRYWVPEPEARASEPYSEWYAADDQGRMARYRAIGWRVYREIVGGYAPDACPAIAGWITSAGRQYLLAAIKIAGWEHVFYVDTDGLMVDSDGFQRLGEAGLIRNKELGYLYLKGVCDDVEIMAIKSYREGDKVVNAALFNAQAVSSAEQGDTWVHESPLSAIRLGRRPGSLLVSLGPNRAQPYRHGVVDASGRASPIILAEW